MRVGTAVTGFALMLCGTIALCLGLGVFGTRTARGPVAADGAARFGAAHTWFWPLMAGISVGVAMVGLVWLLAQARAATCRQRAFVGGATRMLARAASRDLVEDIRRLAGVHDVRVRLTGTAARPRLVMTVVCAEDTDLAVLYTALGEGPVERYRAAMSMNDLPVVVRFKIDYSETKVA